MEALKRQTGCSGCLEGQGCAWHEAFPLPPPAHSHQPSAWGDLRYSLTCPGCSHGMLDAGGEPGNVPLSRCSGRQSQRWGMPWCGAAVRGECPRHGAHNNREGIWVRALGRVGWFSNSSSSLLLASSISCRVGRGWGVIPGTVVLHGCSIGSGVRGSGPALPLHDTASVTRGVVTAESFPRMGNECLQRVCPLGVGGTVAASVPAGWFISASGGLCKQSAANPTIAWPHGDIANEKCCGEERKGVLRGKFEVFLPASTGTSDLG